MFLIIITMVLAQGANEYCKDVVKTKSGSEEFKANRIALVIGVNEYLYIKGLNYAGPDAIAMKKLLEEQGAFTVQLMSDDMGKNPTG
jgi:hypothetical protein